MTSSNIACIASKSTRSKLKKQSRRIAKPTSKSSRIASCKVSFYFKKIFFNFSSRRRHRPHHEGEEGAHSWRADGDTVRAFKLSHVTARFEEAHRASDRSRFYRARSGMRHALSLPRLIYPLLCCCYCQVHQKKKNSFSKFVCYM